MCSAEESRLTIVYTTHLPARQTCFVQLSQLMLAGFRKARREIRRDRRVPRAMSEKNAPLQSIARKTCRSVRFRAPCRATARKTMGRGKTDPIDADYPPPSFPYLPIRWKESCSEEYRCHYTHNQHRCFITPKVNRLYLLATSPVVDCNIHVRAPKKGQVLVLTISSKVFYLLTQV